MIPLYYIVCATRTPYELPLLCIVLCPSPLPTYRKYGQYRIYYIHNNLFKFPF